MSSNTTQHALSSPSSGLDLNPGRQKALLRSVCFGAAFCPNAQTASSSSVTPDPADSMPQASSHDFNTTCRMLRVLNALREPNVGIPLTLTQLDALSLEAAVYRLVTYREWLLAYRIAGTTEPQHRKSPKEASHRLTNSPYSMPLSLPGSTLQEKVRQLLSSLTCISIRRCTFRYAPFHTPAASCGYFVQVVLQWACAKISAPASSGLSDSELKEQIATRLQNCPGVHFAPVAAHAQVVTRKGYVDVTFLLQCVW